MSKLLKQDLERKDEYRQITGTKKYNTFVLPEVVQMTLVFVHHTETHCC